MKNEEAKPRIVYDEFDPVFEAEEDFILLFSEQTYDFLTPDLSSKDIAHINPRRFYDDKLRDMYDHNFTHFDEELNEDMYNALEAFRHTRGENFAKYVGLCRSPFLLSKGFDEEEIITMAKCDYLNFPKKEIPGLSFDSIRDNPSFLDELIAIEISEYGQDYGASFCSRRWIRYADKIKEGDNGLNIFGAFIDGKLVGYCYSFYSRNTVCIDSLLVVPSYRNRYIATSLLAHVASKFGCLIYLHASEEETAKQMYAKLGFEILLSTYEYLRIDKKEE